MSCCLNGTMSAIPKITSIHIIPPLAAASMCIGCARSVQRDSCIGIGVALLIARGKPLQDVHIVLASRYVNATLCKLGTQSFRLSGTMPEMTWHLLTSPQGLIKWYGGRRMGGAAGSNALLSAQNLAASRNIELATWQLCLLLHDVRVHVNSLIKLLKCLFCRKTTVQMSTVVLARLCFYS